MKYSLISPTFGRPEEVTEFLESLLDQENKSFEVILGDGTPKDELRPLLQRYISNSTYELSIVYEEFLPVSDARNRAAEVAKGDYLIFLDSDCIIPSNYLNLIDKALAERDLDLFGGPDAAHPNFTALQKAISYSMTSLFTTGGIRGSKTPVGDYHPRGFNMGIKKEVFWAVDGYSELKCGEDIELSMRIIEKKYKSGFIPDAFVYHKRRTSLSKFFKQVYRFGAARIDIYKKHKSQLKVLHFFPLIFSLGLILSVLSTLLPIPARFLLIELYTLYCLLIFMDSSIRNKSIYVGAYSILTSLVMMLGYGYGFFKNLIAFFRSRTIEL